MLWRQGQTDLQGSLARPSPKRYTEVVIVVFLTLAYTYTYIHTHTSNE